MSKRSSGTVRTIAALVPSVKVSGTRTPRVVKDWICIELAPRVGDLFYMRGSSLAAFPPTQLSNYRCCRLALGRANHNVSPPQRTRSAVTSFGAVRFEARYVAGYFDTSQLMSHTETAQVQ